jgi:iron complex outermembrane receptor protein
VAIAGSTMHFLMALALVYAVFVGFGIPQPDSDNWRVGALTERSPAERAGLELGDRIVTVDGQRLRQRFNLSGSWSVGVDAGAAWQVSRAARLELGGTLLHARADDDGNAFRHLPQRPSHELSAALTYEPVEQLSLRAELRHIGRAFDLAPSGSLVRLPASHEANLRGRWAIGRIGTASRVNMIAAVDNVTDATITPQLGLPLPGRTFRLGFEIDYD